MSEKFPNDYNWDYQNTDSHEQERNDGSEMVDIMDLPPRSEVHKSGVKGSRTEIRSKTRDKKKKMKMEFPLVRILMILFFSLVAIVLLYPIWIEKLFE